MRYCINCGAKTKSIIPPMDNRVRDVCPECNYIHYVNPNNIVGVIASFNGKVLLCKRNTEPRKISGQFQLDLWKMVKRY